MVLPYGARLIVPQIRLGAQASLLEFGQKIMCVNPPMLE